MTSSLEFWHTKHRDYAANAFVRKPNFFAQEIANQISPGMSLIDLGCGQGQDSVYFAQKNITVTACDFSEYALAQFSDQAELNDIAQQVLDLSAPPYGFSDSSFDMVYAHLSLHYFPVTTTREIFAEVGRILRRGGHFYAYFNSIRDPESHQGKEIEPQFRELSLGDRKRFFTAEELPDLLGEPFTQVDASYGCGTTKNPEDQYVRLTAMRKEGN